MLILSVKYLVSLDLRLINVLPTMKHVHIHLKRFWNILSTTKVFRKIVFSSSLSGYSHSFLTFATDYGKHHSIIEIDRIPTTVVYHNVLTKRSLFISQTNFLYHVGATRKTLCREAFFIALELS